MTAPVHLVRVPLRADQLTWIARRRLIPLRTLDDGYLAHCLMTELWQDAAPAPFVLKGRGRTLDAWGYSSTEAAGLIAHAQQFGDPAILAAIDGLAHVASREVPALAPGRLVEFEVRVCPVIRLSGGLGAWRAGAEVDAYLIAQHRGGADAPAREAVYREWLANRLGDPARSGAVLEGARVVGMGRSRLVRRTQGADRSARHFDRPDVTIEGTLRVVDGSRLVSLLATGVGRHRAFGFGAILLRAAARAPWDD